MMGPDQELNVFIKRNDHLNILRYIRAHQLREPDLVIYHAKALLGGGEFKKKNTLDESARLAIIEQTCLSALDIHDHGMAEICLGHLRESVGKDAQRFRMLLARCLESAGDTEQAKIIYTSLLEENPSNLMAMKRLYVMKSNNTPKEQMEALNAYLQQNLSDTSAWYEMVELQLRLGDYKGATFAMEEVLLGCPMDSNIHCKMAELYATTGAGDLKTLTLARKHMAQALELDGSNRRAMFGLLSVCNDFMELIGSNKKLMSEHEMEIAKELTKYGVNKLLKSYKGTKLYAAVQRVVKMYTDE